MILINDLFPPLLRLPYSVGILLSSPPLCAWCSPFYYDRVHLSLSGITTMTTICTFTPSPHTTRLFLFCSLSVSHFPHFWWHHYHANSVPTGRMKARLTLHWSFWLIVLSHKPGGLEWKFNHPRAESWPSPRLSFVASTIYGVHMTYHCYFLSSITLCIY